MSATKQVSWSCSFSYSWRCVTTVQVLMSISIASGAAASMYTGQPVRVSAGYVVALTSAGEATDWCIPRLSLCRKRGTKI
jgi:hypothetical protein